MILPCLSSSFLRQTQSRLANSLAVALLLLAPVAAQFVTSVSYASPVVSGPAGAPSVAPAASPAPGAPQAKQTGVWGLVKDQGATVYSAPNFDGTQLANLPPKTRVVMSRMSYGNQGPQFYKVKFQKNGHAVLGYISDGEIGPEKAGTLLARKAEKAEVATPPTVPGKKPDPKMAKASPKKHKRKRKKEQEPMLFSHYVGLIAGMTDFKENISGVKAEENLVVYGIKITGPDLLLKGPIMDIDVILHSGAPSYYTALSGIKPTGFIIWTDALLLYPFLNRQNAMIYFEAGPLLVLSDFKVLNNGKVMDLFALNAGLSTGLGGAVRVGSVALRLEAKYMFENKSYLALLGTVQSEF